MTTYKNTYICYDCMETRRARLATCRCPKCRKPMLRLHYKIRVPNKERKLWINFKEWLTSTYPFYMDKI